MAKKPQDTTGGDQEANTKVSRAAESGYRRGYRQGAQATYDAIAELLSKEQRSRLELWLSVHLEKWRAGRSNLDTPPSPPKMEGD